MYSMLGVDVYSLVLVCYDGVCDVVRCGVLCLLGDNNSIFGIVVWVVWDVVRLCVVWWCCGGFGCVVSVC